MWQVPSHVLMGIPQGIESPKEKQLLTPLGDACSRLDLTAIHEILEDIGYKDDDGVANEVRFFHWACCISIVKLSKHLLYGPKIASRKLLQITPNRNLWGISNSLVIMASRSHS